MRAGTVEYAVIGMVLLQLVHTSQTEMVHDIMSIVNSSLETFRDLVGSIHPSIWSRDETGGRQMLEWKIGKRKQFEKKEACIDRKMNPVTPLPCFGVTLARL